MCNLPGNQSTIQCNACIWSFLNVNCFPTFIHILNAACYASYIFFSDLTNLCGGIPTMQEYNIRLVWLKVPVQRLVVKVTPLLGVVTLVLAVAIQQCSLHLTGETILIGQKLYAMEIPAVHMWRGISPK